MSDHSPGEGAPDERCHPRGGQAPYLIIVLLRVLVELVQGHEGVQGVRVCLRGRGRGCMTHRGQKPCPRGWADTKGPPPIPSQHSDTERARHRQLPIHAGPGQAGLAQSCPSAPRLPAPLWVLWAHHLPPGLTPAHPPRGPQGGAGG